MKIDNVCTISPEEKGPIICFFYGHIPNCPGVVIEGSDDYRKARTFKVHETVQKCAETLDYSDLIAKLSFGDMHAQDAIYHVSCHTALRNEANICEKKKQAELNAKEQNLDYLNHHAESIALSK